MDILLLFWSDHHTCRHLLSKYLRGSKYVPNAQSYSGPLTSYFVKP